jgi:preprotein translocase subunit SecD
MFDPARPMSEASFGPPAAPPPAKPSRVVRHLLVFGLVALVAVYALIVFLTRGVWTADATPHDGVRTTFTARTLDGSAPSADALSTTKEILQKRVGDLGGSPSDVVVDGQVLTVVAPGTEDDVRSIGQVGLLYVRPVIHSIPAEAATSPTAATATTAPPGTSPAVAPTTPAPPTPPPPPSGGYAQRVADEKALRQSNEQQIQILAMQFQATRCKDDDVLAGNDDPKLPLITCSQDGKTVYLLGPAILKTEQVKSATSGLDEQTGSYVVYLEFNRDGADTWADFTAANVGTQTAFTLDTRVVSAPVIQEAIPGGRTQISGVDFTANSARDFANVLSHGVLPLTLTFDVSKPVAFPAKVRPIAPRIALIAGGAAVALVVIFGVLYLVRTRPRRVGVPGPYMAPGPLQ